MQPILMSMLPCCIVSTKAMREARSKPSAPTPAQDTLPFKIASRFHAGGLLFSAENRDEKYL